MFTTRLENKTKTTQHRRKVNYMQISAEHLPGPNSMNFQVLSIRRNKFTTSIYSNEIYLQNLYLFLRDLYNLPPAP